MLRQALPHPAQLVGPWRCAARRRLRWFVLLLGGTLGLLSCVTLPEQPGGTQPYARLVLPEAIRLVALDTQTFDPRARIREIQVVFEAKT